MLWRIPPARCKRVLHPEFVEPCLPTLAHKVPDGPLWVHEIKHDGFRFICRKNRDRVRVFTRRGHDWTERVPAIAEALRRLRVDSVTLDGEGVMCREDGLTDFDAVRLALARKEATQAFLYAFDVMDVNGQDLRREPWHARRKTLERLLRRVRRGIHLSEHMEAQGEAMFRHVCKLGLEGIVSKRRDAPYRSGRCENWIKVKNPDSPAVTRVQEALARP